MILFVTDFDETLTTPESHAKVARLITGKGLKTKNCFWDEMYHFVPTTWDEYFDFARMIEFHPGVQELFEMVRKCEASSFILTAGMLERIKTVLEHHRLERFVDQICAQSFKYIGIGQIDRRKLSPDFTGVEERGVWREDRFMIYSPQTGLQYPLETPIFLRNRGEIKRFGFEKFLTSNPQFNQIVFAGDAENDLPTVNFLSTLGLGWQVIISPVYGSELHDLLQGRRDLMILPHKNLIELGNSIAYCRYDE